MKRYVLVFLFVLLLLGGGQAMAGITAITVDGNLADWGITRNPGGVNGDPKGTLLYDATAYSGYQYPSASNSEDYYGTRDSYVPATGDSHTLSLYYHLEDSEDHKNGYQTGPLYGGQDYDAEALVVHVSQTDVYIAIATGQRFDNGRAYYAPGDIYIADTNGDRRFGIEVGGGVGRNPWDGTSWMIKEGDSGTHYNVKSDGYTSTNNPADSTKRQAGSIWATTNADWESNPTNGQKTQLVALTVDESQLLADYVYYAPAYDGDGNDLKPRKNSDDLFDAHAFIELSFSIDSVTGLEELLADGAVFGWSPVCGNDLLATPVVKVELSPPEGGDSAAPEPASALVWGGLLLGCGWIRRRRMVTRA